MPNTPVCLIPQCAYWGQAVPCGTFHLRGSGEVHTGKCDVGGVVLYLYVMTKKNSAVPYMHTTQGIQLQVKTATKVSSFCSRCIFRILILTAPYTYVVVISYTGYQMGFC